MDFEIAIYNGGCNDGRKVVNSVKAAYLYADKVRVYDYSIPEGYRQPSREEQLSKFPYTYRFHSCEINRFNYDNSAYLKAGYSNSDAYVLDFIKRYVWVVLDTQKDREFDKEYREANYYKEMLAKLDVEIIVPQVVLPNTSEHVMKQFGDYINKFENDNGLKMFTNSDDINNIWKEYPSLLPSYLSEYAISKLPCFENASFDEIKDIRDELDGYIVPYREAIVRITQTMKKAQSSESLQQECARLYLDEIEPKVAAINAAIRDNNVFKNIARSGLTSELGWSGIGSLVAAIATKDKIIDAVGIGFAVALGGYSVANGIIKYLENKKVIQDNEMYFLYEAGNILETDYS